MNKEDWIAVNTHIEMADMNGEQVLRVTKSQKINEPDENTYAKMKDVHFHNGSIHVQMYSELEDDAPSHARGFIGIAFRINEDDSAFESFYVRPTNGRSCQDKVRKQHGCQYFSYPKYTFSYFREHEINQYENQVDIDLHEWIDLKAVIKDEEGWFYINDQLVLYVKDMKHGREAKGSVGLFVDVGTKASFKNIMIEYDE